MIEAVFGLLGFASGSLGTYALCRSQARRRLREMEDRYTRITEGPPRGGKPVNPNTGGARVAKGKYRHKRGSHHPYKT